MKKILHKIKMIIRWCWATMPRRIVSILVIAALLITPISLIFRQEAKAAWWNDNWMYRIAIPVTNNTTQQNNVYISVTVNTSDTTKFQTDCGDIRFTKLRGELLPYYIVSGCGTASTVIHVNFDIFPAGAQTIYMYYGNPSAPNGFSASDFSNLASNYTVGSLGSEERGPGPVAYWKFDEGQGSTAYNSTSTSGFNGNLGVGSSAPTWRPESECTAGKCLSFDGNDYVDAPYNANMNTFTTGLTVSAWIKPTITNANQWIVSRDDYNTNRLWSLSYINSGGNKLGFRVWTTTGNSSTYNNVDMDVGTWQHVVGTWDGSNVRFYKNGVLVGGPIARGGTLLTSSSIGLRIGRDLGTAEGFFPGSIDEVKIYPYARTAAQVAQDYNSGKSGASTSEGTSVSVGESPKWMTNGLVGHWKMDESSGTSVADASGNGNTGTLTNAQETGTAEAASTTTAVYDADNASLSTTNDAYNNMILRVTGGPGCGVTTGTERTITDYDGAGKYFTVAAYSAEADSCTFEVRHQTGGKFGNGMGFDDDNDYIGVGSSVPTNGNEFTFSTWVNPKDETAANHNMLFASPSATTYISIYGSTELVFASFNIGGSVIQVNSTPNSVTPNTWHHVVVTWGGSMIKMYIDGELKKTYGPYSGSLYFGSGNYRLGTNSAANGSFFGGFMDDSRIYNRALAPDEVRQLSEWGPGPVGWWKMGENVSGNSKTIVDSSGNGNNGTTNWGANASGMDCTKQGKYGGGCSFDGVDDKVNVSASGGQFAFPFSDFSYGTWFYPKGTAGYRALISNWQNGIGYTFSLKNILNQPRLSVAIGGTGGDLSLDGSSDIPNYLNNWHHAMVVKTKNTLSIYVDGKLYATNAINDYSPYIVGTELLSIGALTWTGAWPWNGLIDDTRIYNYARTAKQVMEDMNAGHPVGSPVAYWKMDEGYGGTSQDASQNNQDLTLSYGSGGSVPTWTNGGKFGRALDFEKDNKSFAFTADSAALSITSDLTLTGWIKPESTTSSTLFDIAGKWDSSSRYSYLLAQYGSELRMYIGGTGNYKTTSALGLQTGQWYHVAATYNAAAQTVTLYVNGRDVGGSVTGTIPASITDSTDRFHLGAEQSQGTAANFYDGLIDEVKVYNSALTPDQIAIDMNGGKELQLGGQTSATGATGAAAEYCVPGSSDSCAGPVGEWKFDEKTGTAANDTSDPSIGGGKNGSFGSGVTWTRGFHGSALHFDGNGHFASLPLTLPGLNFGTGSFTVSTWIKAKSLTNKADIRPFEIAWCTASPAYVTASLGSDGKFGFSANDDVGSGSEYAYSAAGAIDLNNWHHVEAVVNRTTNVSQIYVDGKPSGSPNILNWTGSINCSNATIAASIGDYNGVFSFQGSLDDFKIFNYARTPSQIAWDYNRGKPVGWWKMDEGEGDKAYDSSGNGNTVNLGVGSSAPIWVDGKFGKALDFEKDNSQYASVNDNPVLSITKDLTMSAWIKPESIDGGAHDIIDKFDANANNGYLLLLSGSEIKVHINAEANYKITSGASIQSGQWYYITAVYNATAQAVTIYINGTDAGGTIYGSIPASITDNSAQLIIGDRLGKGYFDGQIDDVRIYNYALTAEQVKQVMNEGSAIRFGE